MYWEGFSKDVKGTAKPPPALEKGRRLRCSRSSTQPIVGVCPVKCEYSRHRRLLARYSNPTGRGLPSSVSSPAYLYGRWNHYYCRAACYCFPNPDELCAWYVG